MAYDAITIVVYLRILFCSEEKALERESAERFHTRRRGRRYAIVPETLDSMGIFFSPGAFFVEAAPEQKILPQAGFQELFAFFSRNSPVSAFIPSTSSMSSHHGSKANEYY